MRWGQVKNIMIVVLLAVNAVMFLILVNDYQKVNYIDKAYVEQVVPLLADRGITVSREQIPREKSAVMTRRLAPPGPDMTAFLQALLDQEVAIQPTQSFTCENGNYETENYINFSVKFSEDYLENFSRIEEVAAFLEQAIGYDAIELMVSNIRRDGDNRTVRFQEYARGMLVENCYVDAQLEGGSLKQLDGRLILDENLTRLGQTSRNAVDALFALADYLQGSEVTVTAIQPTIGVYLNTWDTYDSVPVYVIKTAGGVAYRVDMDGEVSLNAPTV